MPALATSHMVTRISAFVALGSKCACVTAVGSNLSCKSVMRDEADARYIGSKVRTTRISTAANQRS